MPRNPFTATLTLILQLFHFFDQFVVDGHIVLIAAEIRHNYAIVMLKWLWIMLDIWSSYYAKRGSLEGRGWIEGVCVSATLIPSDHLTFSRILID